MIKGVPDDERSEREKFRKVRQAVGFLFRSSSGYIGRCVVGGSFLVAFFH